MIGHQQRMLPLCARLLIGRDDLPSVGIISIDKYLIGAHIDHRLNGKHHPWHEQHTRSAMTIMVHIRLFMKRTAHPMTGQVSHHTVMVFLAVLLYRMADIAHKRIGFGGLHSDFQYDWHQRNNRRESW